MATQRAAIPQDQEAQLGLARVAVFPRLRALAWSNDWLYASRCYTLLRARMNAEAIEWQQAGSYTPEWWRRLSASSRLSFRLARDGFHALAVLSSGHLVGVVPHAIVSLNPGDTEFRVTWKVERGTRPLHLAVTPSGHVFWGEYFDNARRDAVHIYASTDKGATWNVAYTFPQGAIRHVHNIVYDQWGNCLWMLTGDHGAECRVLRASCDFENVDVVLSGGQQARAVAAVPAPEGLYFSSDTPLESNHVYLLDRHGRVSEVASLSSSSIYGCRAGDAVFFSTMVEPSKVNLDHKVRVYGSPDGLNWQTMLHWKKDRWPMGLFQYGNAVFPDGHNSSNLLAVTTVAVEPGDLETALWRVKCSRALGGSGGPFSEKISGS